MMKTIDTIWQTRTIKKIVDIPNIHESILVEIFPIMLPRAMKPIRVDRLFARPSAGDLSVI